MKKIILFGLMLILFGCSHQPSESSSSEEDLLSKASSGGKATVFDDGNNAFGHPSSAITSQKKTEFFAGQSFFDQNWVTAPSSTEARDGLGPFFNARSCAACHFRDGRAAPPDSGTPFEGLLLRLSVPGVSHTGGPLPDPIYGGQLQGRSILEVANEADAQVSYTEIAGTFGDGTPYTLLKPTYTITNPQYGALDSQVMISPRVAPHIVGMALLEAIPESDILAHADEADSDGDGISGRPNYVWDVESQSNKLGRFGWKANQPSVRQQVAGAFAGDIGITSPIFPHDDRSDFQDQETADVMDGGDPEISEAILSFVVSYTEHLAVPARRNVDDPIVLKGEKLFASMDCATCHVPDFSLGDDTIHPFTDLLLHDMGEGLADGRPDFMADGQEWRTPPLWGIGLIEKVNNHTRFLHDGRARNFTEAILWHGGEAEASKEAFRNLSASDRDAVITYLESL